MPEKEYCQGPMENIFLCMKCRKPIELEEPLFDVDFKLRFKMDSLNTTGSSMFHEKCGKEIFGKWTHVQQEYLYPDGIHE